MTGLVAIFLGLTAGWLVTGRRQVIAAVVAPFVVVAVIQTQGIWRGQGVSPPSTVHEPAYYIVQAIILALALGIALQLHARRHPGDGGAGRSIWSGTGRAMLVNLVFVALTVLAFKLDRPLFGPGSVAHHSSSGPPISGMIGIGLTIVLCVGLGIDGLRRRRLVRAAAERAV